jgi:hypothetical protein
LTPGDWHDLDDPPPFNVRARREHTLQVPWPLPASVPVGDDNVEAQHFCVRVDIERYSDLAHPEHEKIVVFDNWAQSNFDTTAVGFGSRSDRLATAATATNTLARRATSSGSPAMNIMCRWCRRWCRRTPDAERPVACSGAA